MKKKIVFFLVLLCLASLFSSCGDSRLEQEPLEIITVEGKTYGDASFNLQTTGGSGIGEITFTRVSGYCATVSTSGLVTILGAGSISVRAVKEGDEEYRSEYSRTITLTFAEMLIPLDEKIPVEIDEKDSWYKFSPEEDGTYKFSAYGGFIYVKLEIYSSENLDESLEGEILLEELNGYSYDIYLAAGDYKVKFNIGDPDIFTFDIIKID